jgi:hypothetical protein
MHIFIFHRDVDDGKISKDMENNYGNGKGGHFAIHPPPEENLKQLKQLSFWGGGGTHPIP